VTRRVAFLRAVSHAVLEAVGAARRLELELAEGAHRYRWSAERGEADETPRFYLTSLGGPSEPETRRAAGRVVEVPFDIGDADRGLLRLSLGGVPGEADRASLRRLADTLGVAIANRRANAALAERVKELTCLYAIARVTEDAELDVDGALAAIVERLPPAWQYPELTIGRVVLDGRAFATSADVDAAPHALRSPLVVGGVERGVVEVFYRAPEDGQHDVTVLGDDVFLAEERDLIAAVGRAVARSVEVREARVERERLLERIARADRLAAVGQLAAGVAHELNEPLGGILGFAELALGAPDVGPEGARDLRRIVDITLSARDIIKQLLLFARRAPPRRVAVDLPAVIGDALKLLEPRCASLRITLVREIGAVPTVPGDPGQLQQVLVNLVVNAIHAMPGGGTLTVGCRREGDAVVLEVADTGEGMAAEVAGQVFDPFFTTRDIGDGTGLGLSVSHGIVVAHGGTIEVETAPGRGARFVVCLPLDPSEEVSDGG